jgi:O-antigen/teichoic acid export membrane protein
MKYRVSESFNKFMRAEYIRNVFTLMAGTVIGQALVFILAPFITRLFTPEDFTLLEQYTMIVTVLSVVVTGKYEFAIMHPKDQNDARHIAGLALKVAFYSCVVLSMFFLFLAKEFSYLLMNEPIRIYLWTIPIVLFFTAVFNVFNYWFSRLKQYKVAANSKVLSAVSSEPIKIATGYGAWGPSGLVFSTVAGSIAAGVYAFWKFLKSEPEGLKNLSNERMKALAVLHKDYPLFSIWGSVLNRLAQWAHVGIFTLYYGLVAVGFMALCRRIFMAPLNVVSNSYSQVFFQRISEIEDPKELRALYYKVLFRFLLAAAGMVFIVQMLPSNTMGFIFGDAWGSSFLYLKYLIYWFALNFVTSSLAFITYRINMQRVGLFLDALHFVLAIAAVYLAHHWGMNELEATKFLVISKVIYFSFNILVVLFFLERYTRKNHEQV